MPDERDKRRPHTPPAGVLRQISRSGPPEPPESWEDSSGSFTDVRPKLDMTPQQTLQAIEQRSRETKNTSLTSLNLINDLRKDTREDIGRLNDRLDSQGEKIDSVIEVVSDLRRDVGSQHGQNSVIIDMLTEQKRHRENVEHVVTTTRIAEVEVDKSRQLSDIEVAKVEKMSEIERVKAVRAVKLELYKAVALKTIAALGALWAIISVTVLGKC